VKRTFEETAANYFRYSAQKCNAHYDLAEAYKNRHRLFGIAVVFVSAIVGTSVFASLGKSPVPWIQFCTGLLSVAAVVLAALQTFLGFAELQTQHKMAAAGYGICRRDIELLIMKFPTAQGTADEPGTSELEAVKKTLDELDRGSPTVPDKVWSAVVAKIPPDS